MCKLSFTSLICCQRQYPRLNVFRTYQRTYRMATAKVRSQNNIFFLSRKVTFLATETGIVHLLTVYSVGMQFQQHIPGGYSCEFLVRVCPPVLQILTLFQTQKCSSTPVFRPGLLSSLLRLERKNKLKILQIHFFEFPYFSFFLSTHLELKL